MATSSSQEEQARLEAALDAFLDSDDDDDDNAEPHVDRSHSASSSECQAEPALGSPASSGPPPVTPLVKLGPPRPPTADAASSERASSCNRSGTAPAEEDWSPDKLFANMMQQMLEGVEGRELIPREGGDDGNNGLEDEFIGRFLQEMQSQLPHANLGNPNLQTPTTSGSKAKKTTAASSGTKIIGSGTKASPSAGTDKEEVEAAIANLVEGLTKQATMDDEIGNSSISPELMDHDNMFNNLMEGLAAGIGSGEHGDVNPDAVIDGMMEQLLSKDLMYEPIKQVAVKFPDWLAARRNSLSPKEYTEYVNTARVASYARLPSGTCGCQSSRQLFPFGGC